jgi:O-antigen biosynthesis protein
MSRVAIDGKQFTLDRTRFRFRGVTYGTFAARSDGALYPERERMKLDLEAMALAGFTVVRTYTPPPADVLELASDHGLKLLAGASYADWRHYAESGRRGRRRLLSEASQQVRATARQLAGAEGVLALSLGNEIPADVVRWVGTHEVASALGALAEVVREEDPELLVTYANYPTTEYLPLDDLDFLTFNVFLERRSDYRRYLTRLQHLAGDRPLVLGEVGLDAGTGEVGEDQQAEMLDWQLELAVERGVAGTCVYAWTDEWAVENAAVEGWRFGITRADRSPRPALEVASRWNSRSVADLEADWPSISVVICAYNAEATIDECLRHTCALDYPDLDIVVVDDGSTDATAAITRRHPRARLVSIPHAGLGTGRNAGIAAARGEIVAYLDSDAYPSPEWPYYLALGFDNPKLGGAGGPNVPRPTIPSAPIRSPVRRVVRCTSSSPTIAPSTSRAATWPSGSTRSRRPAASTRSTPQPATTSTSAGRFSTGGTSSGSTPRPSCGTTDGRGCGRTCASSAATAGLRRSSRPATPTGSPRWARLAGTGASTAPSCRARFASACTAGRSGRLPTSRSIKGAATPWTSPTRWACRPPCRCCCPLPWACSARCSPSLHSWRCSGWWRSLSST